MLDLANKKEQLQSALQKLEKLVQDQLRVMQGITDLQNGKTQELAKVSAEYDESLKALDADIQTRRPPFPEERTCQDSEEFPPLEAHDDDLEDLEQSSKRQKSAPVRKVFSSDLVLSEMPTFGVNELRSIVEAAQRSLAEARAVASPGQWVSLVTKRVYAMTRKVVTWP